MSQADYKTIIDLWFSAEVKERWFNSSPAFDQQLRSRFLTTWQAAREGDLDWAHSPEAALALVIVLDQFPLNMFRGQAESFATEAMSREVAAAAIEKGFHKELSDPQKVFLFMPYMHSESLADQDCSVRLFELAGLSNVKWAEHHRDIVRRFGRFPHRNAILGRESSAEELAWLDSDEAFNG